MVKIVGYTLTREDQAPCLVLDWGWFMIWVCHMTFLECAGFEFVNRLKAFVWPAWLPAMFAKILEQQTRFLQHLQLLQLQLLLRGRTNSRVAGSFGDQTTWQEDFFSFLRGFAGSEWWSKQFWVCLNI